MFIVPFIHKITQETNFLVHSIKILTVAGKNLWEEDDSLHIDTDILNSNDIYRKGSPIKMMNKNLTLCEVDIQKTNINDFYKWSDISLEDTETFCWRNYIYISGDKDESWLNIPKNQKLSDIDISKLILIIIKLNQQCSV